MLFEPQPITNAATPGRPEIPDHVLCCLIGSGSYGEVWLARCSLGFYRAVKIVHRSKFSDVRPYEREFSGVKRFEPWSREHEGLVDILQVGHNEARGFFYYVMELADDATKGAGDESGEMIEYAPLTLAHTMRHKGKLPANEVLSMGIFLAEALAYLNSKKLIHRDIKPSNIVFIGGAPKLADVGLVANLEETQSFVGTVGFIPPEGPGTVQADIYSLGKVLYEAATGNDRQEFPNLPSDLDDDGSSSMLMELNEVILKSCAANPAHRYKSAAAMLSDLRRIQTGGSLRQRRVRRRRFRLAIMCSAILGVALSAVWLMNRVRSAGKPILVEDFNSIELDRDIWRWSNKEWPGLSNSGRRELSVGATNGELVVEARAQHEGGWSTFGAAWAESTRDFRAGGACNLEITLAGTNLWGTLSLSISDGQRPSDPDDSRSVKLLQMPSSEESISWESRTAMTNRQVRIEFFPVQQTAIFYPDLRIPEFFELPRIEGLRQWHLRFYALAASSSLCPQGFAQLKVARVAAYRGASRGMVVGSVIDAITKSPVAGAVIEDDSGLRVARTLANGFFKLEPPKGPGRIRATHVDFLKSDYIDYPKKQWDQSVLPVKIELRKKSVKLGDVVGVIPCAHTEIRTINFLEGKLWVLAREEASENSRTIILPNDSIAGTGFRFQTGTRPLGHFTQCNQRIVATSAWPGRIFELQGDTLVELAEPRDARDNRLIQWPGGCTFDGALIWFLETDKASRHVGIHGFDLNVNKVVASIPSADQELIGLAWDAERRQFWVSTLNGTFYSVSRDVALDDGQMESARGREFPGDYYSITIADGYLWGLDIRKKHICKVKIRESEK